MGIHGSGLPVFGLEACVAYNGDGSRLLVHAAEVAGGVDGIELTRVVAAECIELLIHGGYGGAFHVGIVHDAELSRVVVLVPEDAIHLARGGIDGGAGGGDQQIVAADAQVGALAGSQVHLVELADIGGAGGVALVPHIVELVAHELSAAVGVHCAVDEPGLNGIAASLLHLVDAHRGEALEVVGIPRLAVVDVALQGDGVVRLAAGFHNLHRLAGRERHLIII